jgi:hypothetical protein
MADPSQQTWEDRLRSDLSSHWNLKGREGNYSYLQRRLKSLKSVPFQKEQASPGRSPVLLAPVQERVLVDFVRLAWFSRRFASTI